MHLRRYRPEDESAVLNIWLAASRTGHPFLSEPDLAHERTLVRDVYLPKAETWLAEIDGTVVGFIGLLDDFVGGLFVDPAHHGQGVGRALLDHAFALKGHLTVDVYEANPMAPAFYRRCGFVEVGRKPLDDEGRPFPLLVLERGS